MSSTGIATTTAQLRRQLTARVVITDSTSLRAVSHDGSKISRQAAALIRPRNDADISATLRLANKHKIPVTIRGGGSSLTGSATPLRNGWVLDLSRWKKIRLDPEAGLIDAQAGARIADIQQTAEAAGWLYPPDPASKEHCTIGGNIATNAGGMRGGKYGVTRDYILALEAILPNGEKIRCATHTKKFSAGYNLRDLLIGSEGTLAVITRATLKLIPKPAARWTLLAAFNSDPGALRAAQKLLSQRIRPSICEYLDTLTTRCARQVADAPIFPDRKNTNTKPRALILLELAGEPDEIAAQKTAVEKWARQTAVSYRQAAANDEAERLWQLRRKCSSAMFEVADSKLNEDVVLPVAAYEKFSAFLQQLSKSSRLKIPTFGHLADGNFHVNIMYQKADKRQAAAAAKAVTRLMKKVVSLGGAISGEHGIGLAKTPFLRIQHSPAEVAVMQAIKHALDPNNILNPTKIFTPIEVWKLPRLQVRLPWDHK